MDMIARKASRSGSWTAIERKTAIPVGGNRSLTGCPSARVRMRIGAATVGERLPRLLSRDLVSACCLSRANTQLLPHRRQDDFLQVNHGAFSVTDV